jgi:hypothetical protein
MLCPSGVLSTADRISGSAQVSLGFEGRQANCKVSIRFHLPGSSSLAGRTGWEDAPASTNRGDSWDLEATGRRGSDRLSADPSSAQGRGCSSAGMAEGSFLPRPAWSSSA